MKRALFFLHSGEIELDIHLIAYHCPAGFQQGSPGQAEIFAVYRCLCAQAGTLLPVGVPQLAGILGVEHYLSGHAANGQVAQDTVFIVAQRLNLFALESNGWILLNGEEIRRAQVVVTIWLACINTGSVGLGLNPGVLRVLWIDLQLATKDFEVASDGADHHVFDRKSNLRMYRINIPGHSVCFSPSLCVTVLLAVTFSMIVTLSHYLPIVK